MMKACTSCGAELAPDKNFCVQCGASATDVCASCGAVLASGQSFCTKCGIAASHPMNASGGPASNDSPAIGTGPAVGGRICPACGTALAHTKNFCVKCGAAVHAAAAPAAAPYAPARPVGTAPQPAAPRAPKSGKRGKWVAISVIAISAAALAGICLAVFLPSGGLAFLATSAPASLAASAEPSSTASSEAVPDVPAISSSTAPGASLQAPTGAGNFAAMGTIASLEISGSISPQWDAVVNFDKSSRARVKLGSQWGLIDLDGNYVVQPRYTSIGYYYDDRAAFERDGKWGFLDPAGTEIIAPTWDQASDFSDGLAAVCSGKQWGYIRLNGDLVLPLAYTEALPFSDGVAVVRQSSRYSLIDDSGNALSIPGAPSIEKFGTFSEGMIAYQQGGKWGYLSISGTAGSYTVTVAIPPRYELAKDFINGKAIVQQDGRQFFIDPTGIPFSDAVDELWRFSDGFATARQGTSYGYISEDTGKLTIPARFADVYSFADGLCPVLYDASGWTYIDYYGDEAFSSKRWDEAHKFYNDLGKVKQDGLYGFIDTAGDVIVPCEYEEADFYTGQMISVKKNGKWGFLQVTPMA